MTLKETVSMSKLRGSAAIAIVAGISASVDAKISVEDGAQTSFEIGGSIAAECKVANAANENATALDLSSATAQSAGRLSVWCNTGQQLADTTYSSANNGFLIDESGNQIAYSINVGDQANSLSLNSPQTIQQANGSGTDGNTQATDLAIVPQVNGFESSGSYSDTISVTVTYN